MASGALTAWLRARHVTYRSLAALTVAAVTVAGALAVSGLGDAMQTGVAMPLAYMTREALGRGTLPDPGLKTFIYDDKAYGMTRRPALSGGDWAAIIRRIADRRPAAIVTTHMFGGTEFQDDDGALPAAIAAFRATGGRMVAGVFGHPRLLTGRKPLPPELRGARTVEAGAAVAAPELRHVYGPDLAAVDAFDALGHVAHDGKGRTWPWLAVGDRQEIPHLALATLIALKRPLPAIQADARGLVPADAGLIDRGAAQAFSLSALLADGALTRSHVSAGDVVLLLMDGYSGRSGFVATAAGQRPAGWLDIGLLNMALTGQWPAAAGTGAMSAALGLLVGLLMGVLLSERALAAGLVSVLVALPAAGSLGDAVAGLVVPWLSALAPLAMTAGGLHMVRVLGRQRAARRREAAQDRETARLAAIVSTTQMFAHDVRKPFSLLRVAIQALQRQTDPAAGGRVLTGLRPELERAVASVEGMIEDILHIGADAGAPRREPVDPVGLVSDALRAVFLTRRDAEIRLDYDFRNTLPVEGDADKLRRVLVNVIDNAVEAMHGRGRIWLRARDLAGQDGARLELTIGNDGPVIPREDLDRIFTAFHTAGKVNGTGLGLAIARKIVGQHGGAISCRSTAATGTEFILNLPAAQVTPRPAAGATHLPGFSANIVPAPAPDPDDLGSVAAIQRAHTVTPMPPAGGLPRIAVVDDNSFVLEAWELTMRDAELITFPRPSAFMRRAETDPEFVGSLACVVTDYYFDLEGEPTGGDFAATLKTLRPDLPVILASDGTLDALSAGPVDARIGKDPVGFASLKKRLPGQD